MVLEEPCEASRDVWTLGRIGVATRLVAPLDAVKYALRHVERSTVLEQRHREEGGVFV